MSNGAAMSLLPFFIHIASVRCHFSACVLAKAFYNIPLMISLRVLVSLLASLSISQAALEAPRQIISLDGQWLFQRDKAPAEQWKQVSVPSSFQSHEGIEFQGVGWYKQQVDAIALPPGKRLLLHFQAAATEAEVWWDGQRVGSHLGGWTPFRFDITELVRSGKDQTPHELRVRLDEKVGHNTQGFLPVIAPHFGGLWQSVQLLIVPETYLDDLNLLAVGDPMQSQFHLELPLKGSTEDRPTSVAVRYRLRGATDWKPATVTSSA
jgi:beta-galactosidase/beta-glucuronidase